MSGGTAIFQILLLLLVTSFIASERIEGAVERKEGASRARRDVSLAAGPNGFKISLTPDHHHHDHDHDDHDDDDHDVDDDHVYCPSHDPGSRGYMCPQPGQDDDYTVCCSVTRGRIQVLTCCEKTIFSGWFKLLIAVGVLSVVLILVCLTCFYCRICCFSRHGNGTSVVLLERQPSSPDKPDAPPPYTVTASAPLWAGGAQAGRRYSKLGAENTAA